MNTLSKPRSLKERGFLLGESFREKVAELDIRNRVLLHVTATSSGIISRTTKVKTQIKT